MMLQVLQAISQICGWLYLIVWSLSVYPQTILNYRLKSVAGFSLDFGIMNVCGYLLYSVYVVSGFIYPRLGTGHIYMVDLLFPTHSFIIAAAALAQVWIYERGTQTGFSLKIILLLVFQFMVVLLIFTFEVAFGWKIPIIINTLLMTGYMKTITTFFKYCPQVYLNFTRRSTEGLSMHFVLFDLSGGVFAIIQQMIGKNTSMLNKVNY